MFAQRNIHTRGIWGEVPDSRIHQNCSDFMWDIHSMGILPCEAWLPLINWYPRALNYILLHKPHTSKDPVPKAMFWCWDLQILNSLWNMDPENYVPDPGYMILDVPWPPDGRFPFSMTTRLVSGWLTTPGSWDRKALTLKWETKEESHVITTMTSLETGPGTSMSGAIYVLRTSLVQDTEGHSKGGVIPRLGQKKVVFPAQGLWPESLGPSHRNPSPGMELSFTETATAGGLASPGPSVWIWSLAMFLIEY